ncbi:MAG TPA: DUF4139 domain-containing protein [Kofleriaceae bacterium]|nr:DUF4139 domain-containing protein [Kofleriaceae bacterium]
MAVVSVESRLERVTVYASGARVRRVTELAAPVPTRVRIAGLPITVIDDTVRVEVVGPAIATNVRAGVDAPDEGAAAAEETPELRAARLRVQRAEAEVARLSAALDQLARAPITVEDETDEPPAPWGEVVAARRGVVALRTERGGALREALAAARREAADAQRAAEAAADRDRRAGTARAAKLHELRKHVEVELLPSGPSGDGAGAGGAITLHLEYLVGAARWAPSYVARIDGERAAVEVRAVVAQDTGEDWTAVPLLLSTAEPARFAALPELAAQRIGRRQAESARGGFRSPPVGAAALFADYDRDRRRLVPAATTVPVPEPRPFTAGSQFEDGTYMGHAPKQEAPIAELSREVWDEGTSLSKEAYDDDEGGAVGGYTAYNDAAPANEKKKRAEPMPEMADIQPQAKGGRQRLARPAEQVARSSAPRPSMASPVAVPPGVAPVAGGFGGGRPKAYRPAPPPPPAARLDYGNLRMAPAASPARGRLVPAPPDRHATSVEAEVSAMRRRVEALALPEGCAAAWLHTYDYAFATDGAVDVRADGAWHSIAVTAKAGTAKLRHVAVPREQADVFRVAAIENPLPGPILPGPIDVYDRGRFLVTSAVDFTPPGGSLEIGLGVDPAVKIARNTEFREEVGGMLRGALKLIHAITIDVENVSGRAVELEVRERVPVAREGDDDVEITLGRVEPAWERWTPDPEAPRDERLRGGHRWRLTIPAAQKRTMRAGYEVKISGRHELVGGNRRES